MRLVLASCFLLLTCGCSTERDLEIQAPQPTPWHAQIGSRLEKGLTSTTLQIGDVQCVDLIRPGNILVTHGTEIRALRGRVVERRGWPKPDQEGPWVDLPGDTTGLAVRTVLCGP